MPLAPHQNAAHQAPAAAPSTDAVRITRLNALALDAVERVFLVALYGWLSYRIIAACLASGTYANLILLPLEGVVVVFVLIRRRTNDVSRHPGEWLLAIVATCAPLMVRPETGAQLVAPALGILLMLCGALTQMHAKLAIGRSFGIVPANRGIKLGGPYRIVRHPMYAGYLLTHIGFLALNPSGWNLAAYAICNGLQVVRLLAEERLLGRDPSYQAYVATVRYRLIPGVF
jgi:protein-S-isoprenylcysteine O-methyltransferase Ste14